jgi:hypothetical protein
MRAIRWKGLVLAGTLVVAGGVSITPIPVQACVFVHEFQKSSKSGAHVSVWERVVYSLIEARHQTADRPAPRAATSLFLGQGA